MKKRGKLFLVVLINAFSSFIKTNTFPLSVRSRALGAALGGCFSLCCISSKERSLSNGNPQAMSLTEAEKKTSYFVSLKNHTLSNVSHAYL